MRGKKSRGDQVSKETGSELMYALQAIVNTAKHHLTTGMHSKKCVLRQFHHCANIVDYTYTNLRGVAYYTPRLYCI